MINLNQLRIFCHVAKNLSYTQAAKELFVTQPAVTAQVKFFEDNCGLKLFKKKKRRVYLTQEGEALYECARKIFEYEKEVEGVIEDLKELKMGTLRLGTSKAYARYRMPALVTAFHRACPGINICLNEGSSLEMAKSLLSFDNDLAIVARADEDPQFGSIPFCRETLMLILPPKHRYTTRKVVTVEDLAGEPLIMKEMGSATRKAVDDLFARHNCTPNIFMETSNTDFIKELVERGEGIAFLVKESVHRELGENRIATVPVEGETVYLWVKIVYVKDQPLSAPAEAFLEVLRKLEDGKSPLPAAP